MRKLYQLIDVGEISGNARSLASDAGISRSAEHLGHARRLPQLPRQGMLATAAAKNQNPHRAPARNARELARLGGAAATVNGDENGKKKLSVAEESFQFPVFSCQ
jgi:hypothetical protein